MLTSQNGIREFHSGPKYGRIEIGDHKLTKIDRGQDPPLLGLHMFSAKTPQS